MNPQKRVLDESRLCPFSSLEGVVRLNVSGDWYRSISYTVTQKEGQEIKRSKLQFQSSWSSA